MKNCCMCGSRTNNNIVNNIIIDNRKKFSFEPNIYCNKCLLFLKKQIYKHLGIQYNNKVTKKINIEKEIETYNNYINNEHIDNKIPIADNIPDDLSDGINIDSDFDLETGEVFR